MLIISCQKKPLISGAQQVYNAEPLRWRLAESGRRLANPLHASTLADALTKARRMLHNFASQKHPLKHENMLDAKIVGRKEEEETRTDGGTKRWSNCDVVLQDLIGSC